MRLNPKVAWGLAWAGLAVVVAVPSLDFFTGKSGTAAVLTSTTDPVKSAAVTTTVTPTGIVITPAGNTPPADPVSSYLTTNKQLPSYISSGAGSAPTQVATLEQPAVVAPVPFPSWARPPDAPPASPPVTDPAAAPPVAQASSQPAVIVDENDLATQQAEAQPAAAGPVPPEPIVDDSANWRAPGLEKYLDRNGLLDTAPPRSTASVTVVNRPAGNYDPNGFYLSDGPNNARAERRARVEQLFNDDNSSDDSGFTLF